jgi:hypothetical protein
MDLATKEICSLQIVGVLCLQKEFHTKFMAGYISVLPVPL